VDGCLNSLSTLIEQTAQRENNLVQVDNSSSSNPMESSANIENDVVQDQLDDSFQSSADIGHDVFQDQLDASFQSSANMENDVVQDQLDDSVSSSQSSADSIAHLMDQTGDTQQNEDDSAHHLRRIHELQTLNGLLLLFNHDLARAYLQLHQDYQAKMKEMNERCELLESMLQLVSQRPS
jgi:exonuclease VII large subunit